MLTYEETRQDACCEMSYLHAKQGGHAVILESIDQHHSDLVPC